MPNLPKEYELLLKTRINTFKSNQIKIIEELQEKIMRELVDSSKSNPEELCDLSEALKINICVLEHTDNIYES